MADPYTIRIHVPDGDPEGLRTVDHLMNWDGIGIAFPRGIWKEVKLRPECKKAGVYILKGYDEGQDELPTIYVGQGDPVGDRIDSHYAKKDFWDSVIVFVSKSEGLNKAHISWLEHALIKRASELKRCTLNNVNAPQEPTLDEVDKANARKFLDEIFRILHLVKINVFDKAIPTKFSQASEHLDVDTSVAQDVDTVVVPAQKDGFERMSFTDLHLEMDALQARHFMMEIFNLEPCVPI